jgi:hypothetical protein
MQLNEALLACFLGNGGKNQMMPRGRRGKKKERGSMTERETTLVVIAVVPKVPQSSGGLARNAADNWRRRQLTNQGVLWEKLPQQI